MVSQNPSTTSHKPWPAPGKAEAEEEVEVALRGKNPYSDSDHPVPAALSTTKRGRTTFGPTANILDSSGEICGKLLTSPQNPKVNKTH